MDIFGYDIGTFTFFTFSFLAALFIFISAIFGCKEETSKHRWVRGVLGFAYLSVTYIAFMQLEGTHSPYQQQLLPFVMMLAGKSMAIGKSSQPRL